MQPVEQQRDVAGEVVHRRRRLRAGLGRRRPEATQVRGRTEATQVRGRTEATQVRGRTEATQVRGDEAPAGWYLLELRPPHVGIQRKRMDKDNGPSGAGLEVSRLSITDSDVRFTDHGSIIPATGA